MIKSINEEADTTIYSCILVEDEPLAYGMMQEYIRSSEHLALLGTARTLAELKELLLKLTPEIIFLDLIIPPGGCRDFDYSMLPADATVVVISGIPLAVYDQQHLLNNPIELLKPVSHERFISCVGTVVEERRRKVWG